MSFPPEQGALQHLVPLLLLLPVPIAFVVVAPCVPFFWRERALADDVKILAEKTLPAEPTLRRAADADLRRRLQSLARARGFALAFNEAYLEYGQPSRAGEPVSGGDPSSDGDVPLADAFEGPRRIGYTLPIKLPLFGTNEYTLSAVRVFRVAR